MLDFEERAEECGIKMFRRANPVVTGTEYFEDLFMAQSRFITSF